MLAYFYFFAVTAVCVLLAYLFTQKAAAYQAMKLERKTDELITAFQIEDTTQEEAQNHVQEFVNLLQHSQAPNIESAMRSLTSLFGIPNITNGSFASTLCGYLVEKDYATADPILAPFISFYQGLLKQVKPFYELCDKRMAKLTEEEDKHEVFQQLLTGYTPEYEPAIWAHYNLEASYYLCGIAIFSNDLNAFKVGKEALTDVNLYTEYNTGCHWLARLLKVLFEEPILVIDLNTKKGFIGKTSGIVDNLQLQLLLMGMKELNTPVELSQKHLAVMTGEGPQSTGEAVMGQWNMYNWEYLKNKQKLSEDSTLRESDFWIWSEGIPEHISQFEGYRVVLLGDPAYKRHLNIERMFTDLKADISVDQVLSEEEVDDWLRKITN